MNNENINMSFSRILSTGLSIWLLGGIIFWLAEMIVIIIGLPQSWDYKFLRDGMSILGAISLTLLPEKISMTLLIYILMSFLGGLICSFLIYLCFKKSMEEKIDALIISMFLVSSFFIFSAFWLNLKYLPPLFSFNNIVLNATFIFVCIVLAHLCFKLFITRSYEAFLPIFIALAFALDVFMFGGLFLFKSFSIKIFSLKGIAISFGLIIVCFGLFHTARLIFRLKPFTKLTSINVEKWVFSIVVVLVVFSTLIVMIKEGWVNDFLGKRKRPAHDKPNVILIVMDTTRADHLSCYGYKRNTSPHIDKIAEEGALFKNVISPSSWTLPSHASMFTGLFPSEHGAGHVSSYLPEIHETLARILKKQGYQTLAYSNNPYVSFFTGLSANFDDFQEGWKVKEDKYFYEVVYNKILRFVKRNDPIWLIQDDGAAKTTRYVSKWIEKNPQSPFFVFINYMEPHLPYNPPPPFNSLYMPKNIITSEEIKRFSPDPTDIRDLILERQRSEKELSVINALYDGEITYLDGKIWELYERLRDLNILDKTLLIITSDHGENLGNHGVVGHAFGLFNTLLDVPLIVRYPKLLTPGLIINESVQIVDIFYTILDVVGINHNPSNLGLGRSLIKRIKEHDYTEMIIAERDKQAKTALRWAKNLGIDADHINKDLKTIVFNGYKYVQSSKGEEELYNLNEDPDELHNILPDYQKVALILKNRLTELIKKEQLIAVTKKTPQMHQQTKEKLRSLGYIK